MIRKTPDVFTDADRPLCRSGYIENQDLIHLAIFGWLQAREAGREVPDDQAKLVRDCLAAIVVGRRDPREVFGWPAPGDKRKDKRFRKDGWREQWMAAETLRLVRQDLADDEIQSAQYVADAYGVTEKTVTRALAEWRDDLEAGDLDLYIGSIKSRP